MMQASDNDSFDDLELLEKEQEANPRIPDTRITLKENKSFEFSSELNHSSRFDELEIFSARNNDSS
jgi:hypothetical protein